MSLLNIWYGGKVEPVCLEAGEAKGDGLMVFEILNLNGHSGILSALISLLRVRKSTFLRFLGYRVLKKEMVTCAGCLWCLGCLGRYRNAGVSGCGISVCKSL